MSIPSWKSFLRRAWDRRTGLEHSLLLTREAGPRSQGSPLHCPGVPATWGPGPGVGLRLCVWCVCLLELLQVCGLRGTECPWLTGPLLSAEEPCPAALGAGAAAAAGYGLCISSWLAALLIHSVSRLGSSRCESGPLLQFPLCPPGEGTHVKYLRFCCVRF